ncbi:unnamed protein product [Rangifer tarandus platyrhynchus]|uniref:Uncharacterized protein n=2 Tax=Rangifer tarandus platyrhynchus TaxID=3082113 RepID=A0ACB0E3C6_RANTA|nr:unnamed protein product [Rangifer tarandus platyrhynchus]CAI9695095.1 unnamed protein product [Rangifer tarandus platyrhynchus]
MGGWDPRLRALGYQDGGQEGSQEAPTFYRDAFTPPPGQGESSGPQPLPGVAPRPEKDLGRRSRAPHSYLFPYLAPGGPWGGGRAGWGPQGRRFRAAHWRLRPALRSLHPSLLPPLLRASRPRLRRRKVGTNRAGRAPRPAYGRGGASCWAGPLWGRGQDYPRPPAASPAPIRKAKALPLGL